VQRRACDGRWVAAHVPVAGSDAATPCGGQLWECDLRAPCLDVRQDGRIHPYPEKPWPVNLRGAYYDYLTQRRSGFDPRAAGARLEK